LLQDWLGGNNYVLEQAMFDGYQKMPIMSSTYAVTPDCYIGTVGIFDPEPEQRRLTAFPNPANHRAQVGFSSQYNFQGMLSLHSLGGSLVSISNVSVQAGNNRFYVDVSQLPPGPYFVRLENRVSGSADIVKLSVAR
jgi:hypothetical protein